MGLVRAHRAVKTAKISSESVSECDRRTDGRTDKPNIANSRSRIGERDKTRVAPPIAAALNTVDWIMWVLPPGERKYTTHAYKVNAVQKQVGLNPYDLRIITQYYHVITQVARRKDVRGLLVAVIMQLSV